MISSTVVDIEVGGTRFRSTVGTFCRSPFLRALFEHKDSGVLPVVSTDEGLIFVDRCPTLFSTVLQVLRAGDASKIDFPTSSHFEAKRLADELDFYGLKAKLWKSRDVQGAVVSARWSSSDDKLFMHVEAPKSVHHVLEGRIEDYPSEDDDPEDHETDYALVMMSEEVEDAREIPASISQVVRQLRQLGFAEIARSECSSFAQEHLNAKIEGTLFPRRLHWEREVTHIIEDDDPRIPPAEDTEFFQSHVHWVSETITMSRTRPSFGLTIRAICQTPGPIVARHCAERSPEEEERSKHQTISGGVAEAGFGISDVPNREELILTSTEATQRIEEAQSTNEKEATDTHDQELEEVLQISEQAAVEQENSDISQAVLQSKTDESSRCVVLRLTLHSAEIKQMILETESFRDCIANISAAGCETSPGWADGALLLVPLTQSQVEEAGWTLKPFHIIARICDQKLVEDALSPLPRRKRPKCKEADEADLLDDKAVSDPGYSGESAAMIDVSPDSPQEVGVEVEGTFLPHGLRASSSVVQSAPCGSSSARDPINPRRIEDMFFVNVTASDV